MEIPESVIITLFLAYFKYCIIKSVKLKYNDKIFLPIFKYCIGKYDSVVRDMKVRDLT